jgi:hypothetical protein
VAAFGMTATAVLVCDGPRSRGRGRMPQTVTGTGEDDIAALRALDDRLRGREDADGRLDELVRGFRPAYVDGAEAWTRENVGRGLTSAEMGRSLRDIHGDGAGDGACCRDQRCFGRSVVRGVITNGLQTSHRERRWRRGWTAPSSARSVRDPPRATLGLRDCCQRRRQ